MDRVTRRLGSVIAVCLVAVLLGGAAMAPASAAAATAPRLTTTVTVTPATVAPGQQIKVTASGFAASEQVGVFIDQQTTPITTVVADAAGAVPQAPITVPAAVAPGQHTLTLSGASSHRAVTIKITLAMTLTLNQTTVKPGGQVTVSGAGFLPNEIVDVILSPQTSLIATLHADAHGAIAATAVTVPATYAPGAHTFQLLGTNSHRTVSVSLALVSTAALVVTPATSAAGLLAKVSGSGFAANEMVDIILSPQTTPITTVQAGANGVVPQTTIMIPASFAAGAHTLTLTGRSSHRSASATLTLNAVTTTMTVTPVTITLGTKATIAGSGFAANETVEVLLNPQTTPIATLQANANGVVPQTEVTIPATFANGAHTLTLVGTVSHRSTTAKVTLATTLTVSQTTVTAGNQIKVSGAGFLAHEAIEVILSGHNTVLATVHADANGAMADTMVTIPAGLAAGSYTLQIVGLSSHRTVSVTLTVQSVAATVSVVSATTNRGGLITISGGNFMANEAVTVMIQGLSTPLATLTANAQGQIVPTDVSVPYSVTLGAHVLMLTGTTSKRTATANINVAALSPAVTFTATAIRVGDRLVVTGHGFGRQEQITLALNGVALTTTPAVITTNNGSFSATIVVPAGLLGGSNTISVIGTESRVSVTTAITGIVPVAIATTLYFAGASTMAGEQAILPILNNGAQPARIALTFYYRNGAPGHAVLNVAAHSRATANLNALAGTNRAFGIKLTADRQIAAQLRVMRSGKDGYGLVGVPAPTTTWYLTPAYTGGQFHEMLDLVNPGMTAARVQLHLMPQARLLARDVTVDVAAHSTRIVNVDSLLPGRSVGVIAHASQPIVLAHRIVFGPNGYGSMAKMAVSTPATSWLFAEAAASGRTQTFLTILNPQRTAAVVTAGFFGPGGRIEGLSTATVPAMGHATITLNRAVHGSGVAIMTRSNVPVVVERSEIMRTGNGPDAVGSDIVGRNGAGLSWSFASGTTADRNEYLYVYNPSSRRAAIAAAFYGTNGQVMTRRIDVPAHSRYRVDVRALVPGLTAQHGITLRSLNGVGVVAEQALVAPNGSALQSSQGMAA